MTGPDYGEGARPSILLISDEEEAGRAAYRFLREGGANAQRPERLANARPEAINSPIWVELAGDRPEALEDWLDGLNGALADYPATISLPASLLDLAVARVDAANVEILVDPTPEDRLVALALMQARFNSVAQETSESADQRQLRKLSEEVARIAETLARMTEGKSPAPATSVEKPAGDAPAVNAETVRAAIRARRLRDEFFDAELFADPAWDMLLDLLAAEIAQHRVPVSSLCIAAAVPPTTALRWMKTMTDRGIFLRVPDPHDGRRVFIELAPHASSAMRNYFSALQGRLAA